MWWGLSFTKGEAWYMFNRILYIHKRLRYLENILKRLGTKKPIGKFRIR